MREIILFSLLAIPIFAFIAVLIVVAKRHRERDSFSNKLMKMIDELGGKHIEGNNYRIGHSVYNIIPEPSITIGTSIRLKLSVYSDSLFDYSINEAHSLPEMRTLKIYEDPFYKNFSIEGNTSNQLESFLLSENVKTLVKKLMGKWKRLQKNYLELSVSENKFQYDKLTTDDLKTFLKTLEALNLIELNHKPTGGFITVRTGFEKNIPPWHWKKEQINGLPADIQRVCFSFYDRNPYLNQLVVEIISILCGNRKSYYLTDYENPNVINYSFESSFEYENPLFSTEDLRGVISVDNYSDGKFFQGFIALDRNEASHFFKNAKRYQFDEIASKNIDKLYFYVKRLLDHEGAWYSGEYEIISLYLTPKEIADALQTAAQNYDAKLLKIDAPFSPKIFSDEKFEFST